MRKTACSIKQEYIIPANVPFPDYYRQKKALTVAKKEFLELKEVHSQVLQEVIGRLDKAFNFFWGRGSGFPRFKKFGQFRSITFPQFDSNPVTGHQLKLPKKIGSVRINLHRPIPDGFVIKQAQLVKKASGWYAILTLQADIDVPSPVPEGKSLGIDLGLEKFLAVSTGELIARPRFFVDLQSKLKWLQRKLRNKKKGSKNMRRVQQKIARLHERIHDTRKNFHYKIAHHLCEGVGMLFAEDLNLKAMSRGMLCKHTLDAGFGGFLEILAHTCWKRGVYFALVDASGTSQTCPNCLTHIGKKGLSQRVHECGNCGFITDRDVAAAMVVEQRGLTAVGQIVKLPVEEESLNRGSRCKSTTRLSRRSRKSQL